MRKKIYLPALAAFLVFLGLSGCATNLKPSPVANRLAGSEDTARSDANGVTVLVQAVDWPGPVDIRREVTPLRIRIENKSGAPLNVHYNEFALIDRKGKVFSALPLAQIKGEVAVSFEPYELPKFHFSDFSVAPTNYSRMYPGIEPFPRFIAGSPFPFDVYYNFWAEITLPTPEMRQRAIPEGYLNSGGDLEGWLYFKKVDDKYRGRVVFNADLTNAETGRKFAEVRIPFTVE